jgi:Tol biopolymer transport system component
VADTLAVTGSADWSPDMKWLVAGGDDGTGAGLFKIPLSGGPPVRLTSGQARNPVWSPVDGLIVFAGTNSGGGEAVLAVTPDGNLLEFPNIRVSAGGERIRFLPNGKGLVYMQAGGAFYGQNFYLLDLATRKSRPLTRLDDSLTMRAFDITPDGKQIIFDRLRYNSDIVQIELPAK